ncbi:MAG: DnaD domain protein, partial [Oscillospiraceae bacterium]|nr:DnaD domain protein [Oscillospiraceae bacterium]
ALGIQGRRLSPTERKYIDDWITLGFGPEALALAADRTVTNTGDLKWKYMNSIVHSWHQKGLHTVEEIEKGDRKPAARRTTDPAP